MGQRASNTASVTFEDVVVPKEVMYLLDKCKKIFHFITALPVISENHNNNY